MSHKKMISYTFTWNNYFICLKFNMYILALIIYGPHNYVLMSKSHNYIGPKCCENDFEFAECM